MLRKEGKIVLHLVRTNFLKVHIQLVMLKRILKLLHVYAILLFSLHQNSARNVKMQQQQKKHFIILILSRKEDYQNLLKPHRRRFLSHCLVFERFKKVSESLALCWNFTIFISIFLSFFVFVSIN